MFCPECGKQIPDDSVFCPECGARVEEEGGSGQAPQMGPRPAASDPVYEAPKDTAADTSGGGTSKNSMIYIAAAAGVLVLAIAGYLVFKNLSGKGGAEPEPEESVAVTSEVAKEEPSEEKRESKAEEKAKEDSAAKASADAEKTDKQEASAEDNKEDSQKSDTDTIEALANTVDSANLSGTQETFDEDYPQGFTEEVGLTDEDLAGFAERLSTTESAKALDFEWFIDYVNNGGTGPGKFLKDPGQVFSVTGDMTPILNGGWKCFMFTKAGDYGSDGERYCNAEVTIEGEKIYMTVNFDTYLEGASGKSYQEDAKAKYKGTIDPVTGKATLRADDSMIEIDNFFSDRDIESEYAVGTFHWISGEIDQFGLMREYFP